ncbi:hypothetical protein M011DRAFT_483173 [Sporormia fimetaria CBS 119925]|uniref:Uncharacterized protein n=1 Tax=Sporormia fimetaria CBS 119925 TaxID=1340428 RepID=A0A6A6VPS8_9PLEO|nr:hypothetical protein M011DRAFT_483173 [Sporormia fimetaria CBS 119925]
MYPPYEATQVLRCFLTDDPMNQYSGVTEAVVKVKYQVQGSAHRLEMHLARNKDIATKQPTNQHVSENISYYEEQISLAKSPVGPNDINLATVAEEEALSYFKKHGCASTPHLLLSDCFKVDKSIDDLAMEGGYAAFMIMTKIPGNTMRTREFWALARHKRDTVRAAFKTALIDVWNHHVYPRDTGLRNIMWDDAQEKCYIVDFEDYEVVNFEDAEAEWNDQIYSDWEISEAWGEAFRNGPWNPSKRSLEATEGAALNSSDQLSDGTKSDSSRTSPRSSLAAESKASTASKRSSITTESKSSDTSSQSSQSTDATDSQLMNPPKESPDAA